MEMGQGVASVINENNFAKRAYSCVSLLSADLIKKVEIDFLLNPWRTERKRQ